VSSIGNNAGQSPTLRHARSGIVAAEDYIRLGFRSGYGSKINLGRVIAVPAASRARRGYCWWR
jgi:hypothetical protein